MVLSTHPVTVDCPKLQEPADVKDERKDDKRADRHDACAVRRAVVRVANRDVSFDCNRQRRVNWTWNVAFKYLIN